MLLKLSTLASLLAVFSAATASPVLEERDAWSDQVLALHNAARAQYGASPLTWNAALYPATLQDANACKFEHTSGQYGENLFATTGSNALPDGIKAWMNEAAKYNYNNPGFSAATGHFTQVVWKSTTQVACAVANCAAGTIFSAPSKFLVCRYTPPGNYIGQFPQNVGRPVA